jgi:hypothetical protein
MGGRLSQKWLVTWGTAMGETETLPYYYPLFGWDNLGVTATPSPGASWFAFTKIGVDEMSDTL